METALIISTILIVLIPLGLFVARRIAQRQRASEWLRRAQEFAQSVPDEKREETQLQLQTQYLMEPDLSKRLILQLVLKALSQHD